SKTRTLFELFSGSMFHYFFFFSAVYILANCFLAPLTSIMERPADACVIVLQKSCYITSRCSLFPSHFFWNTVYHVQTLRSNSSPLISNQAFEIHQRSD
uniref:Uncharacterized protein n=1 Tax=Cyprinus carpio TaxID=7962 RepID=A0A8C1GRR3_CYPCA